MLSLKDLMAVMDRWEAWKTTKELAAKVPDLERRVSELETLLSGKAPADFCRKCGERTARIVGHPGVNNGLIGETFVCSSCNGRDQRWCKG